MDTLELIRGALADYIDTPAENIVPEAALADIGVDSLTLAELLFDLEDKHAVHLGEDIPRPVTVGDLVALVAPYLGGSGALAA
ncbi:MAG: acyl carrier protein [Proteobacteria bacterium]|nr:acyl carrier protein [Pseudomonadota bacterium]